MTQAMTTERAAFEAVVRYNQHFVDDFKRVNITALTTSINALEKIKKAIDDSRSTHGYNNSTYALSDEYSIVQALLQTRYGLLRDSIVALRGLEVDA